jgi:hypothetical protein
MRQLPENSYDILSIPIEYDRSFLDLTKEETKKYFNWFLSIKQERLSHFCSFLFLKQEGCLQEMNLDTVEVFLLNSVSVRFKSEKQINVELGAVPRHLRPYAEPDNYMLDKRTISICYDIGIFLGELIIKVDDRIKWKLKEDTEYADYGQPVLSKRGSKFEVNPFRVVKNAAAKIYEKRYVDGDLIGFFNVWKKSFGI